MHGARGSAWYAYHPDWRTVTGPENTSGFGRSLGCRDVWIRRDQAARVWVEDYGDCVADKHLVPGIGVAAALVAIIAIGFAWRRR